MTLTNDYIWIYEELASLERPAVSQDVVNVLNMACYCQRW